MLPECCLKDRRVNSHYTMKYMIIIFPCRRHMPELCLKKIKVVKSKEKIAIRSKLGH